MTEALRVLMADDDEDDYRLTGSLLVEAGVDRAAIEWVSSYEAALEAVVARRHDVYLVDYSFGPANGLDLIRAARKAGVTAPMVVLTGRADRNADLEAMRAGATDYLVKGEVTAQVLERTLRYAAVRARDVETLRVREAQLRQAQKLEAVGRLAGGIAHDFNNLMTTVTGFAEVVLASLGERDPLRQDVAEILKAGQRASNLTRQLLTFSRRQVVAPVRLDLNAVVREIEPMLRRLAGAHVEVVSRLGDRLAPVLADSWQMQQALLNLAANARDAMPSGGRLVVETTNVPPSPDGPAVPSVRLSVADTGVGMDADTRARLFEPFFTTKPLGEGSGLGLAAVYGIVEQSGGTIQVTSEERGGSVFTILLPAAPEESATAGEPPAAAGATLLVAEDEAPVRSLLVRLLRAEGYTVLEAADGEAALEAFRAHTGPIDALVTDLVMPRLNGRELAARLRASRDGLRVLYLSAYPDVTMGAEGPSEPGGAFLPKPFSKAGLLAAVRGVLGAAGRGV
jgi:signal transduction histidine kinase